MNEHFSVDIVNYLSERVECSEKSKEFLKLLQLIQYIALTNKNTKSINIYKGDPTEFSKTGILFFKYNYDDFDIETLKELNFNVTFHEKSQDFWLYGVINNYYEISWKRDK